MDEIKKAFQRVREDMEYLNQQISNLALNLAQTQDELEKIKAILVDFSQSNTSTHRQEKETFDTNTSTHNTDFKPLKAQNLGISIGNGGVSTDRQTDRQTNRHTMISSGTPVFEGEKPSVEDVSNLLESLDSIKREIRLKFKKITEQEMLVFSAIYQIEEEKGYADYKTIALKANLTESSIRDYVGRLINKGIPVDKLKVNNKYIQLRISPNLKKIASLQTILSLRDI